MSQLGVGAEVEGNGVVTARLQGHHRGQATPLSLSPELKAIFGLFARLVGAQAVHVGGAQEAVRTISALSLCGYRSDLAAVMLGEKPGTVRARVLRMKSRVMEILRETSFVVPVRPSIEQNEERWDPSTFDEHAELSE